MSLNIIFALTTYLTTYEEIYFIFCVCFNADSMLYKSKI